jgi:hypothetical protein
MVKEAVTLEIEVNDIIEIQRIAHEQHLTVKQWMERAVSRAIANDSPPPTSQEPRGITHRVLQ